VRDRLLVGVAAATVGLSRWLARARVPDNYDSIGFVRALDKFDLQAFQPHPPGYPVYVALGKLAHLALPAVSPLGAACAVSALASAATAVALFSLGRAFGGVRVGACALALYAAAAMPLLLGGAALSDETAGAFAAWAAAWAVAGRWNLSAVSVALMCGARPSWFVLALSWAALAILARRARALAVAAAATCAWLIPFLIVVGPARWLALSRAHVAGHFTEWGGTVVTRPDLAARAGAFVRGLLVDGIGLSVPLFAVLCTTTVWWLIRRVVNAKANANVKANVYMCVALATVPYAAWCLLAQNILEQPRHLLPLVLALILGLSLVLARALLLAAVAVALALAANVPLAIARVRTPPAAAQAAAWIESHEDLSQLMVFGGRSLRFLSPSVPSIPRTWLSEVDVELERVDRLPARILVTSEVEADPVRARRLRPVARFCRDPRLDRQLPCVGLFRYTITN
jgi:hypothetical protein